MGKTYWLLSSTRENFQTTRDLGFSVQGVDTRQRRKAVRMAVDDRMIFYISDRQAFAASTTLTSGHFEDHERIWNHHSESEDFPHRVKMRADVVVEEEKWLGPLHQNVVYTHGYEVDTDRIVLIELLCQFQLGAHAIGSRDQDGFVIFIA